LRGAIQTVGHAVIAAQIADLLCRGLLIRRGTKTPRPPHLRRSAEWHSAIQQIGNLRYDRPAV
jgi:hypothetical protein